LSSVAENETLSFEYVNLNDVDPSFQPLDAEVYDLRITKAELKPYKDRKTDEEKKRIAFTFVVTDHPKFSGRKLWESFFPNNFAFGTLRRIMDATGITQTGSLEDWLTELSTVQPTIRVKVDIEEDVYRDGTPNPKTVKADGTAALKNVIAWKSGVQPGA
jgi:hypothetical protein